MSATDLLQFIANSPSPYHCVAEARRLLSAGWEELDLRQPLPPLSAGHRGLVCRGGTLLAWVIGDTPPGRAGFTVLGAHTDSPNLRLKPNPDLAREGARQWGVEVYGGVLLHTWFDRDLGLSGRVTLRAPGGVRTALLRVDEPVARVASLAIHLNRAVNDEGFKADRQQHLPPLVGLASEGAEAAGLLGLVARTLDVDPDDVLGLDLGLHDVVPPTLGGLDREFIFAPRLDNQASCYTALAALLQHQVPGPRTAVIALYDHEECGSQSAEGADSALLEQLLGRLVAATGGGELAVAAANSLLVSADMAHAVHPNYADRHEPQHKPRLNGGPVIKVNTNNRYATTGQTAGVFAAACAEEGVPVQRFVTRTDLPCGTTIGPLASSRLAMPAVDVGNPMLSMHSIREQAGAADVERMIRVKARLLAGWSMG